LTKPGFRAQILDHFILNLNSGRETLWKAVWTLDGKKVLLSVNKQNVTRYVCRKLYVALRYNPNRLQTRYSFQTIPISMSECPF